MVLGGGSLEGPLLPQGLRLISPAMGRPGLLAATSPSLRMWVPEVLLPASPWMGQFDLKGKLFPKPQLGGGGGRKRWGFLPLHPGRSGCRASGRQSRVSKTMTKIHALVERGMRVLGSLMALASSQVCSLAGLATSVSMCGKAGGCRPGNAGEPSELGRQEPTSALGPRAHATSAPRELGWLSSSRLPHVGQEGSWGQTLEMTVVLLTSSGPGHWHTPSRMARAWRLAAWPG